MSALLLLSIFGCNEQEFKPVPTPADVVPTPTPPVTPLPTEPQPNLAPDIDVDPLLIDFGAIPAGTPAESFFTIYNLGDGPLSVSEVSLSGDPGFALAGSTNFVLQPGDSSIIDVTFLSAGGASVASAVVVSDDPDEAVVDVLLTGSGVEPDLEVTALVDFGTLDVPCDDILPFTLTNVGGAMLTVDSLQLDELSGAMLIDSAPTLPFTLAAGASQLITVAYSPTAPGVATALLTVGSDDPDGDETGEAVGVSVINEATDSLITPPNPPLDIVFVVDQSGSMNNHAQNMSDALTDFISGVGAVTDDWRIGVVTFDDGCFNTWFDAATPGYAQLFEDAVREGDQNDPNNVDTERLFALSGRALQQGQPGLCNDGFRRPDGFLHLILVSDEEEQSHDPNALRIPYNSIAGAQGVYEGFVQTPGMLQVSVVANLANACQTESQAIAQGAARYINMANNTNGLSLDICDSQWGTRMADLGSALPAEYAVPLSAVPDPATITVEVNGGVLFGGFTYDPIANTVVVTTPLDPGSSVDVTYALPVVCN